MSTCRSCGAPVIWVRSHSTGKMAPLDATPSPSGNIAIESGGYRVVGESEAKAWAGQGPLYTNHFATCPTASQWRSGQRASKADE